MRFFIGMFSHETNTFSTIATDRRQFEVRDLRYGGEIREAYRGTGTCLGGMIGAAEPRGVTLLPSLAAAASPAGRVTRDFYEEARARLLADLRAAGPLDGVLLDLHGAMVPEGSEDGEGDLLASVREAVGPAMPISVTLDFHANLTAPMVRAATLLHGYKTIHYRAAFEPIAHAILEVDAPGLSSSNLGRFDFKHVRRPIFPLDDL